MSKHLEHVCLLPLSLPQLSRPLATYGRIRSARHQCITYRVTPPSRPPVSNSLDQPTPATLAKAGGGLARYIGLPRWPIVAVNRDPTLQEYGVGKPSNNSGAYAVIHSGGLLVREKERGGRGRWRERAAGGCADCAHSLACVSLHTVRAKHSHYNTSIIPLLGVPPGDARALHGGHPRGAPRRVCVARR